MKGKKTKLSLICQELCFFGAHSLVIVLIVILSKRLRFSSNAFILAVAAATIVFIYIKTCLPKMQISNASAAFCLVVIAFFLITVITAFSHTKGLRLRLKCVDNLRKLEIAMQVYADENNRKYPTSDKWCDLLIRGEYVKNKKTFRCPSHIKDRCSYAINPNATPDSPPDTVLIFETQGGWNQAGGPEIFNLNHGQCSNILFNGKQIDIIASDRILSIDDPTPLPPEGLSDLNWAGKQKQ